MKFHISPSVLLSALEQASVCVASQKTFPVLRCVNIEAFADSESREPYVAISSSDLEKGVRVLIDADVTESGELCLNEERLSDGVACLKSDEMISLTQEGAKVVVRNEGSRSFSLPWIPAADFPKRPEEKEPVTLDAPMLSLCAAIATVAPFVAPASDARPLWRGALLEGNGEQFTLLATDGKGARIRRVAGGGVVRVTIPEAAMNAINKLFTKGDGQFRVSDSMISVESESIGFWGRLLEGDYPNLLRMFDGLSGYEQFVEYSRKELLDALAFAKTTVNQDNPCIQLTNEDGKLFLDAPPRENGESGRTDVPLATTNLTQPFYVNPNQLIAAVKSFQDTTGKIEIKDRVSPCLIRSELGGIAAVNAMRII